MIFPQDNKNLSHIHADHCGGDMNLNEFKKFCGTVWSAAEYNFVVIDLTSNKLNGKYRMNLNVMIKLITTIMRFLDKN